MSKKSFYCLPGFCKKSFETQKGLSIHKSHAGHWTKPKPSEIKEHVNFKDFVNYSSWGIETTKDYKNHPSVEHLKLGLLFHIRDLLVDIKNKLNEKK